MLGVTPLMTPTKTISNKAITKRGLTTPQLLKAGLCVTWSASLLLALTTIFGVQKQRHTIQTVGKDSAPSIILAQRIKDGLAGMDANAVNELLVKPGENPRAIQDYEERRKAFSERIIGAAQNITYGDAELKPIQTLQLGQEDYIVKLQQARDFNERGDAKGVLSAYRQAAQIMDNTLLPAADALAQVNAEQLEITYAQQGVASTLALFFILMSGLLLLTVLIALQLFLNHRMRRILNPMLLAATAIALLYLGYTTRSFLSASHDLKVATQDAFASMRALREGRSFGYVANADESRYLLDTALAAKHEEAFFNNAAKIAKIPQSQTFETVAAALAQGKKVDGFTGLLAVELNNITFPGEREAAMVTLSTFGRYFTIEQQIHQLEQSGQHDKAIALCTGYNQGQSNWAFDEFKKANSDTININEKVFDQAVEQGFKEVDGFEMSAPIVAVVVSLLTLLGLLPRIQEYN